jgi:hypothetical protein
MNVTELIAAVEARYWCMIGPARAYFEIWHDNSREYGASFEYVEIGAKVKGRLVDSEDFLCDWLSKILLQWPSEDEGGSWHDQRGECLFWRLSSKIEVDEQEFTPQQAKLIAGYLEHENPSTKELLRKGGYTIDEFGWWSKIYTRLVIPGRDLSKWKKTQGETLTLLERPA